MKTVSIYRKEQRKQDWDKYEAEESIHLKIILKRKCFYLTALFRAYFFTKYEDGKYEQT